MGTVGTKDTADSLGTLLLALDAAGLRQALAQSLAKLGWVVHEAESLDAAVALLGGEAAGAPRFDAVIALPPLDTVGLLERARLRAPHALRLLANAPDVPAATVIDAINRAAPYRWLKAPLDLWQLTRALQEGLAQRGQADDEQQALVAHRRRRAAREQVAREHPDAVPRRDGSHLATPSPRLVQWESAAPFEAHLVDPDARQLLEDGLALLVRQPRQTLSIEPRPPLYELCALGDRGSRLLASIPPATAESLLRRLARLCALELEGDRPLLGQLLVETTGLRARLLVSLQPGGLGWRAELHRLLDWRELDEQALLASPRSHEYRFLTIIAESPLAIVYRALDITLERHTLVKMLRQPASIDPIASARLLRQARAEGRISHPGVVQLLDYGSLPDGRPFVAHELVEWPPLRDRLARGRLSLDEALPILHRLAATLAAAHGVNVVHRGLTPDCILLDDDGTTKIGDFGFARLLHERGPRLTVAGQVYGDPHYLAPEQISDGAVTGSADLYALGCIAWEMLSGTPPFDHSDPWEILGMHRDRPPPRLLVDGKALPGGIEALLQSWLHKDPGARPDATDATRQLEQLRATGRGRASGW